MTKNEQWVYDTIKANPGHVSAWYAGMLNLDEEQVCNIVSDLIWKGRLTSGYLSERLTINEYPHVCGAADFIYAENPICPGCEARK